jgi:glycosyltransferase involved in cell wall biosynthesis
MKVVHIGKYRPSPIGGVGKTILEHTRSLSRNGVDVELWEIGSESKQPEQLKTPEEFPVWKLPVRHTSLGRMFDLPKSTRDWIMRRRDQICLLHMHSVFTPTNCVFSKLGLPYVVTPNGGWSKEVLEGRNAFYKKVWISLFEKRLWSKAFMIQAVSRLEAEQLRSLPDMARVEYIPNGTDMPESVSPYLSRSTLLFLGRYGMLQKGLDVLVEALVSVKDRLPPDFRLVMAGADYRGGRAIFERMIEDAGLSNFVETHGPVFGAEKALLFQNAKLFIHTSRWEGLPLVLLEALSHGIPCILTPGTNIAQEWEEVGCAFSVEFSADLIGKKILQLWSLDLSLQSKIAQNYVSNEFNWDKIAARLKQQYAYVEK